MFGQFILISSGYFLLLIPTISGHFALLENSKSEYKTCNNDATFKQFFDVTLPYCADECFRQQRCETFMFHHGMNFCALKEFVNLTELGDEEPSCAYYTFDNSSLGSSNQGPCWNNNCGMNERCSDKTETEHECLKFGCPAAPEINNTVILTNAHEIGATIRYKCNHGYIGVGTPTASCGIHATWEHTDFSCTRSTVFCLEPKSSFLNAELTAVDGYGYYNGTVLHFTCREGYKGAGDTATSTCVSGEWYPDRVACCPDSSTNFWRVDCLNLMDGGIAHSDAEAISECDSIGGYWRTEDDWYELDLIQSKPGMDWILLNLYKDWINNEWNYTACAVANGGTVDSSLDFDGKVAEVLSNNWVGDECWWGHAWATGNPAGGYAKNCVYFRRGSYKYEDYNCIHNLDTIGFVCGFAVPFIV